MKITSFSVAFVLLSTVASRGNCAQGAAQKRLFDTQWTLESLPNGIRPLSPINLSFKVQRWQAQERPALILTAGNSCNTITATVEASANTMRFPRARRTMAGCSSGQGMFASYINPVLTTKQPIRFHQSKEHLSFDTPEGQLRYVRASKWQPPQSPLVPETAKAGPFDIQAAQGTWTLRNVVIDLGGRFVFPDADWRLKIVDTTFELIHPCGSVTGTIATSPPLFMKSKLLPCFGGSPAANFNLLDDASSGITPTGELLLRDRNTEFTWRRAEN